MSQIGSPFGNPLGMNPFDLLAASDAVDSANMLQQMGQMAPNPETAVNPAQVLQSIAVQAMAIRLAAEQWQRFAMDQQSAQIAHVLDDAARTVSLAMQRLAAGGLQNAIATGAVKKGKKTGAGAKAKLKKMGKAAKAAKSKAVSKAKATFGKTVKKAGKAVKAAAGSVESRVLKYKDEIMAAARKHKVPPGMIAALIEKESGGRADAKSFDGGHGKGLMQIDDRSHPFAKTAKVWDPKANIEYGASVIARALRAFPGNQRAGIAAYNAGVGGVQNAIRNGRDPSSATYAKGYISGIQSAMNKYDKYF